MGAWIYAAKILSWLFCGCSVGVLWEFCGHEYTRIRSCRGRAANFKHKTQEHLLFPLFFGWEGFLPALFLSFSLFFSILFFKFFFPFLFRLFLSFIPASFTSYFISKAPRVWLISQNTLIDNCLILSISLHSSLNIPKETNQFFANSLQRRKVRKFS